MRGCKTRSYWLELFEFPQRQSSKLIRAQAFNLSAADDNATAKDILRETRNDNRDLTSLVSLLTLIFLPGSFFTVRIHFLFNLALVLTCAGVFRHEFL
jgi:hypothetical protein